jgi:prophage DNA circulation protein
MIQTQQGSFRGIPFNFESLGRKSGRKSVFHTFPNSDIVLAEDLGRLPRAFSMNIFIHGTPKDNFEAVIDGKLSKVTLSEYYRRKSAIIDALEAKGPGELVHPTYGTHNVQIEGAYSLNENISNLNVAKITVTFVIVNKGDFLPSDTFSAIGIPNASDNINNQAVDKLDKLKDIATEAGWNIVRENVEAIQKFATDTLKSITDSELYNNLTTKISELTTFYNKNVANIGAELDDLFTAIEESIPDPLQRYTQFTKLFDYNDALLASLPAPTTEGLLAAFNNTKEFRDFVQVESLTRAVNSATEIPFKTEDELDAVASTIYNQYDKVMDLT